MFSERRRPVIATTRVELIIVLADSANDVTRSKVRIEINVSVKEQQITAAGYFQPFDLTRKSLFQDADLRHKRHPNLISRRSIRSAIV